MGVCVIVLLFLFPFLSPASLLQDGDLAVRELNRTLNHIDRIFDRLEEMRRS